MGDAHIALPGQKWHEKATLSGAGKPLSGVFSTWQKP